MQEDHPLRVRRRALLCGIAVTAVGAALSPSIRTIFDRIVMRDGWILRESDLT